MKQFNVKDLKVGDFVCIESQNDFNNSVLQFKKYSKIYCKITELSKLFFEVKEVDNDEYHTFLNRWFESTIDVFIAPATRLCKTELEYKFYLCDQSELPRSWWKKLFGIK